MIRPVDWSHIGLLVLVGVSGGLFGSALGVGGGAFIVPLLTLAMRMPVKETIACSIVAVAGTACASAASYIKAGFTNVRLALLLETTTTAGAIAGAFLAALIDARVLAGLFAMAVIYTAYSMFRQRSKLETFAATCDVEAAGGGFHDSLSGSYHDSACQSGISYRVKRVKVGLGASSLAGVLSGLLGIGGGVVQVPVMNMAMGVPMKAAVGTSSFMIGITAIASAFVYYQKGFVDPMAAGPVLVGVFIGVQIGVRAVRRVQAGTLKLVFSIILTGVAALMLLRAAGIVS
ncbi:MAG: sulfite exporter TauE/SafE family protein [Dehalococcoidia bacterium]|nr:sulfite exporter TauE/SafE family protein [Dehalococcoidia bacterium]